MELLATIAATRAEYISGKTLRVNPNRKIALIFNIPHDESQMLFAIMIVGVEIQCKLTSLGRNPSGFHS
jgi:hypothetical protein